MAMAFGKKANVSIISYSIFTRDSDANSRQQIAVAGVKCWFADLVRALNKKIVQKWKRSWLF